jgi:hypothetical protein
MRRNEMELNVQVYSSLCATSVFVINGITADSADFGDQCDHDNNNAEDYGCGDMVFTRKQPDDGVLNKYKISKQEYEEVCEKLEDRLSFGYCDLCT